MALDRNFWTGFLVIGTIGVGVGVFALSAANQFRPNATRYVVAADDLAGADVGTAVDMRGYELGVVENVKVLPSPTLHFELTVALRPEVPIPVGTVGLFASRSVAGGVILHLIPPVDPAPALPPGATVVATRELALADLLPAARDTVKNLQAITGALRAAMVDGKPFTPEPGDESAAAAWHRLNQSLERMHTAFVSMDAAIGNINGTATRAGPALEQDLARLDTTLQSTNAVASNLNRRVDDNGELAAVLVDLHHTLSELDAAAAAIQAYDPDGNTDMARMVDQLDRSTANLDKFMEAFKKKPLRTLTKGVPAEAADDGQK